MERASMVFGRETKEAEKMKRSYEEKQEQLEKLVGQLTLEVSWLKKKSGL
jgi:putative transposase